MSQMRDVQDQLLAILVRDFGYTEAPTHGHHPLRHQFGWIMATEGRTREDVTARVDQLVDDAKAEGEALPDPWREDR